MLDLDQLLKTKHLISNCVFCENHKLRFPLTTCHLILNLPGGMQKCILLQNREFNQLVLKVLYDLPVLMMSQPGNSHKSDTFQEIASNERNSRFSMTSMIKPCGYLGDNIALF